MAIAVRRKLLSIKFDNYIPEPNSGCHLWLGGVDKDGYGVFPILDDFGKHKSLKAHREAFRYYCVDPGNKHVLHHCDTPCCINVAHLYLGNPNLNAKDRVRRGRSRGGICKGEAHGQAKLSAPDVLEIRRLYLNGIKQRVIADRFNIKQQTVSKIVNNKRW